MVCTMVTIIALTLRHPKISTLYLAVMGVYTSPQKRLPLTIHDFQLKIDIFTCNTGNQYAYDGTHHGYHERYAYFEAP